MNKNELRKIILAELKALEPETKKQNEERLLSQLFQSDYFLKAKTIGITLSQKIEIDTQPIIEKCQTLGKKIVIPRTGLQGKMDFCLYEAETSLETTSFGILEPTSTVPSVDKNQIDLLIVPGVAFSIAGYRIGFGAGFYDRYLANYQGDTVSLVLQPQIRNDWTPDSYDIPVKKLFTE
ncbi:5-formyltetrahydrofolate cyclo-ligase [Carnobacterium divergens]|uniref:5-formyltetrahydrofolate cyclo-ligase n=1 Tax=Carnobacterium divergens TaxID=2748 RepID=UPI001071658A|nr:5-formyltetrahydrofolate cyclo-ligase [Carnobacterium divergens]TFI70859.1 5-formyltetrahydrofolate cyclo-ligase [Carnobacterium divergens]